MSQFVRGNRAESQLQKFADTAGAEAMRKQFRCCCFTTVLWITKVAEFILETNYSPGRIIRRRILTNNLSTILDKSPWDSTAIFIFFCHLSVPSWNSASFSKFSCSSPSPHPIQSWSSEKILHTRVQHCLWGEGRDWTCVNWKTPKKHKSVPRLLSMIGDILRGKQETLRKYRNQPLSCGNFVNKPSTFRLDIDLQTHHPSKTNFPSVSTSLRRVNGRILLYNSSLHRIYTWTNNPSQTDNSSVRDNSSLV